MNFAAVKLLGSGDTEELGKLFNPKIYEDNQKAAEIFDTILKKTGKNYTSKQEGVFYEVTHRATQAALAAKKMQRSIRRKPEPGEKCSQCGEFEVLHARAHGSGESVEKYRESINDFWDRFRSSGEFVSDFSDKERLCSVCALKRIIYRALKADRAGQHILRDSFLEKENYPSTTFLALYDFFRRNNISDVEEKKKISQELFEGDTDSLQGYQEQPGERDKYYAILLMDGDRMGKLVNGETISANRKSIMHPQIIERLQNESFFAPYHEGWEQLFELRGGRRFLSPAVHAAISESLGDFSLYGVKPIIHKYSGTLIYAGGDDVCAVLPVSRVLPAAREIAAYYTSTFRLIKKENGSYSSEVIEREWTPEPDKLSVNLGTGKDISISAGILVCHHKEALKDMIFRAHALLDKKAKKEGDRNACAIELRKRSGGSRYFVRKFDAVEKWEAFETISKAVERGSEDIAERVSGSLIYRLESFREGFEAILHSRTLSQSEREGRTIDLLKAQLKRSVPELVERGEDLDKISKSIHHLIMEGDEFKPEALIVSAFFGKEVS
ncbi:MAG TPA: type III-B CRISPR-associated protein Cas10/Cmr2 [Sediminispirochaeta sp.]|nr:type III-B CRISPR-associated protein Cas10/Cmr2 [Sediminispirochaeta sp.]